MQIRKSNEGRNGKYDEPQDHGSNSQPQRSLRSSTEPPDRAAIPYICEEGPLTEYYAKDEADRGSGPPSAAQIEHQQHKPAKHQ
jgi:hypothetical protein